MIFPWSPVHTRRGERRQRETHGATARRDPKEHRLPTSLCQGRRAVERDEKRSGRKKVSGCCISPTPTRAVDDDVATDPDRRACRNRVRYDECDICVPEELREHFAEMQPVFKNIRLTRDDGKKTVTYALPVHVGLFVLQYAKMRMLQLYYDFINRYMERLMFQYCEMHTDSAYLALVGESVDALVTQEVREYYFRHRSEWLPSECCDEFRNEYVRCRLADRLWNGDDACCKARRSFDKRTMGLFNIEWSGDGFVGLCSKT